MADELNPQFDATREGSAKRWQTEFKAARERLSAWHTAAKEADSRYLDEHRGEGTGQRLNLFAAGTDLKEATLYGNTPKADVSRIDDDQDDDVARVAAAILDRTLNIDLRRTIETFPQAIGLALKDWLLPGFGLIWLRLERETRPTPAQDAKTDAEGAVLADAVPAGTQVLREEVCTDYVYWEDVLWSPARVFGDWRWAAKRTRLSKKTIEKKFGKEDVPLAIGADPKDNTVPKTPWARAEVWEIWDKERLCVWWYIEGHSRVLVPVGLESNPDGSVADPLGVDGFWPFPEPLIEGNSTSKYVPRPSYARAQDQYANVDDLTTRIGLLRDAVKAAGVYDKTVGELEGLLKGSENKLVPAANYAALAEKGGIAACIAWLPLEAIVEAMDKLRETRREEIDLLFQVDGTSDIMRGQATVAGATATEQAIKAKYGSIRGDKSQRRFAQFCSDGQRIRGEIICKHFSPQTIAARANVAGLPQEDQPLVQQAIQLLQSDFAAYRVVVKPESVSLTDYAANKQESLDVLGMIGTFMQAVGPLMMQAPQMAPKFLELLMVFIARVKGGDAAESVLDSIVKQAKQAAAAAAAAAQQPRQDPKLQVEQVKAGAEQTKAGAEQFRARADVVQTQMDLEQSKAEHAMSMQKLAAEVRADALRAAGVTAGGTPQ